MWRKTARELSKAAANVARRQLLQNPSAYAVPTTVLLGAFELALKAAFNAGAENKPNPGPAPGPERVAQPISAALLVARLRPPG